MTFADVIYYSFKAYIKLIHDTLLLRHRYVEGLDNVPAVGERFIIVSNHQNTGNDAFNMLFALPFGRHTCAMARANLFEIRPWITSFLYWVGMVPAYRMGWEGASGLDANQQSFSLVAERVNQGFPFMIFPQAGHTQGHYLGRFTTGTIRIAMQAAEQNGWKDDIKILPTALCYSNFFEVQTDLMWRIAPAVSLKPYYDEYQQHPATVMRRLTHQIHDTVQQMMLDEGIDDYAERDFLRLSSLNVPDRDAFTLPQLLERDQAFIRRLVAHPQYTQIIDRAKALREALQRVHITEPIFAAGLRVPRLVAGGLGLLLLLPLWVVSLWPHLLCYLFPFLLLKTDPMFTNTYRYVFATLLIYPLAAILTVLVLGLGFGLWWQGILWVLLTIPIGKFAWWYYDRLRRWLGHFRLLFTRDEKLRQLHNELTELFRASAQVKK